MSSTILYLGSFNPVHNGHTSVVRYVMERELCDRLWFVVSPRNPHKPEDVLAPDADRLRMTEIAIAEQLAGYEVAVNDIEFSMPKPSYTIDTLRKLASMYPGEEFSLLVGGDIAGTISSWKEADRLLRDYRFIVYPREGYDAACFPGRYTYLESAPRWDFSSTDVREAIAAGADISRMVSPGVDEYIRGRRLWK